MQTNVLKQIHLLYEKLSVSSLSFLCLSGRLRRSTVCGMVSAGSP